MTKKQHKAIAEMWAAGLLIMCGCDSFDKSISEKDADAIVKEVDKIAVKLQKGRKQMFTLREVIDQELNQKEVSNG
jgi:hypothetical protein